MSILLANARKLQRNDPRVATERSERLHGFRKRILLSNARKLQRNDPRVATERSERLHGFRKRILLANARSRSLSFGDYAKNKDQTFPN
jgi:ribosomal protein L34